MRNFNPGFFGGLLCMLLLTVQSFAQVQPSTTLPSGLPSSAGSQLPQYQDRLKQLQNAGVNTNLIPGQESGSSTSAAGTSASGFPTPETPQDVNLVGQEEVLDEEDKEYQDKPKEITEINLEDSLGIYVYGHQLFSNTDANFNLVPSPVVSDKYIIGPGDIFAITIFGQDEQYESLTVASDGSIIRPYIGKLYLGGLTFGEARKKIESRYRNIIQRGSSVEVRLTSDRRSININFVGEVRNPGSYRLDAAVPAFNALFAAGGVTDIGTVRNIAIKREGKIVQILDLYEYLLFGLNEPIYLKDNDFIFVPTQGRIAEVEGPVKRPMKYELREGENLKALINFSGGFNFDAKTKEAQIGRLENEREVLIDFNLESILTSPTKDFTVFDGDKLILREVNKGAFNITQIFGDVEYPGTYQLNLGEKLSDIIVKAGGLSIEAYRERAYIVRIVPKSNELLYIPIDLGKIFPRDVDTLNYTDINNIEVQYFDAIIIFSQTDFLDERVIEVDGQVRKPGTFKSTPTMTLKDLLYLVGGPKQDADFNNIELTTITKAEDLDLREVENTEEGGDDGGDTGSESNPNPSAPQEKEVRTNNLDDTGLLPAEEMMNEEGNVELIRRIPIAKDWENDPLIDTLKIYQFDRVKVYSKYDFIFFKYIDIEGSVVNPGRYQIKRGMSLKDIFYMAGGLTEDAVKNKIELHKDIDIEERGNFNTLTQQREIERITLDSTWQESIMADSILVGKYHKVVVRSELDFFQQGYVQIKGLVNLPGEYEVLPRMSLKDLFYMANGLKMEADFENIELSRVFESVSETGEIIPVHVTINTISSTQNWQQDPTLDSIMLNAFDQIIVRENPDFRLQESVFLQGEVRVKGEYNKSKKDETLSSFISRSGGITELAYTEGAYVLRPEIGSIAIKLDKALKRPNSRYNIPLLDGDTLIIPPRVDIVYLEGNVMRPGIKVLYEPKKKKLKYYTRLAGGFAKRTKKNQITVTYVDGRVKGTRKFLMFRSYPKVEQGSLIEVAKKPDRDANGIPRINLQEITASITSFLTFYLLIDRTLGSVN